MLRVEDLVGNWISGFGVQGCRMTRDFKPTFQTPMREMGEAWRWPDLQAHAQPILEPLLEDRS